MNPNSLATAKLAMAIPNTTKEEHDETHGTDVATAAGWLGEPVADAGDMLLEETGAEILQPGRGIVERSDDRLALRDVERDDPCFAVVGAFEPFGGWNTPSHGNAGRERTAEMPDVRQRDMDPSRRPVAAPGA